MASIGRNRLVGASGLDSGMQRLSRNSRDKSFRGGED